MPNFFYGLESDIGLQIAVLAFGCATFCGVILCSRCPHCSWLEWISDKLGRDEAE